jgi:hypothetical protein
VLSLRIQVFDFTFLGLKLTMLSLLDESFSGLRNLVCVDEVEKHRVVIFRIERE